MVQQSPKVVLCLDVGNRRIGVALVDLAIKAPHGLDTIDRQVLEPIEALKKLVKEHTVTQLVLGLPRDINGNETQQTRTVLAFAETLKHELSLPLEFVDEAGTSIAATEALEASGKPYQKADVDRQAAIIILQDWLTEWERIEAVS